MAMPEVTYSTFVEEFGDEVKLETFTSCLPHAVALVRDMCWPNVPTTDGQEHAWTMAVCAAIMADALNGAGHGVADVGAGSFTIGKFSMSAGSTGSSSSISATTSAMREAARRHLTGTGLMYRVML